MLKALYFSFSMEFLLIKETVYSNVKCLFREAVNKVNHRAFPSGWQKFWRTKIFF